VRAGRHISISSDSEEFHDAHDILISSSESLTNDCSPSTSLQYSDLSNHTITDAIGFQSDAALINRKVTDAELTGAEVVGAEVAGAEVAGAEVAGAEVAGAEVAGAEVASAEVASVEVADAEVADAEVADAEIVKNKIADTEVADQNIANRDKTGTESVKIEVIDTKVTGEVIPHIARLAEVAPTGVQENDSITEGSSQSQFFEQPSDQYQAADQNQNSQQHLNTNQSQNADQPDTSLKHTVTNLPRENLENNKNTTSLNSVKEIKTSEDARESVSTATKDDGICEASSINNLASGAPSEISSADQEDGNMSDCPKSTEASSSSVFGVLSEPQGMFCRDLMMKLAYHFFLAVSVRLSIIIFFVLCF